MQRPLTALLALVLASASAIAAMPLRAAWAAPADLGIPGPPPATVASPVPYFAIFAGGFLLLSFVLILIGPRNDHRR